MAIAEPVLRSYGIQGLKNLRSKPGSIWGTAIGIAVSVGYGISQNYDIGWPKPWILQPSRSERGAVSGTYSSNGGTNQLNKALRTQVKRRRRYRNKVKHGTCGCYRIQHCR